MKCTIKNTLKPGAIALGLGLMLTTLCYGQFIGPDMQVTGSLMTGSPSAVSFPNPGINGLGTYSVFYQGYPSFVSGTLW